MNHNKELLRGLWVKRAMPEAEAVAEFLEGLLKP